MGSRTATVIRRIARWALPAIAAVALAGCEVAGMVSPREWTSTAELTAGGTQTIVVRDRSGRIADVEIEPLHVPDPDRPGNLDGRADTLIVPWVGGACDERTEIEFRADGQGLAGDLRVRRADRPCDDVGVRHLLKVTTRVPITGDQVTLSPPMPLP